MKKTIESIGLWLLKKRDEKALSIGWILFSIGLFILLLKVAAISIGGIITLIAITGASFYWPLEDAIRMHREISMALLILILILAASSRIMYSIYKEMKSYITVKKIDKYIIKKYMLRR